MFKDGSYTGEQLDVIKTIDENQVVDAIPGSGKTYTILGKAFYEAEKGRKILLITHTNTAVNTINRRLQRFSFKRNIEVRTIHSLAYKELGAQRKSPYYIVRRLGYEALLDEALKLSIPTEVSTIIVDEAQDTNDKQRRLIEKYSCCKIFVGDQNQTIFTFAGANPNLVPELVASGFSYKTLSYTFRSSGEIVEYFNAFKKAALLPGPKIKAYNKFNTSISFVSSNTLPVSNFLQIVRYNKEKTRYPSYCMNYHEVKGMEFNKVFINIPYDKFMKKDMDKYFLLYVGLTRAKYRLVVAGFSQDSALLQAANDVVAGRIKNGIR